MSKIFLFSYSVLLLCYTDSKVVATMFGRRSRNSQVNSNKVDRSRTRNPGKIPESFKVTKITQIPDEEWYSLTPEQKKKIQEARRECFAKNPRNKSSRASTLQGGRFQRGGRAPGGRNSPGGRRVRFQENPENKS